MNQHRLFRGVCAFVLLVILGLTACQKQELQTEKQKETESLQRKETSKPHIEIIAKDMQHQYWKAVEMGAGKAAEELGVEISFQGARSEPAVAQQLEFLNLAIAKKPAAICLAALDADATLDILKKAQQAGIPVIGFDSGLPNAPEDYIRANVYTDNIAAGQIAAQELYKLIKEKVTEPEQTVRIGVVAQDSISESIVSRTEGFVYEMMKLVGKDKVSVEGHERFRNEKTDAKVILEVGIPKEVRELEATAIATTILEKPDLIAIYGSNELAANAIIGANESLNKIGEGKVVAVGFDAGAKQLEAIASKLFAGSITQDPVQIGYQAVQLAYMAYKGEPVRDVNTGAIWYHAGNMKDPAIAPCLYR